ncbi:hypothetical protein ACFL0M_14750 [Thermodesulfobacteriota bacterium]
MPGQGVVYRPRNPQNSTYYRCVEDHLEAFEQVYEDRFQRRYGFFRPYVKQVIYRYLDCVAFQRKVDRFKLLERDGFRWPNTF